MDKLEKWRDSALEAIEKSLNELPAHLHFVLVQATILRPMQILEKLRDLYDVPHLQIINSDSNIFNLISFYHENKRCAEEDRVRKPLCSLEELNIKMRESPNRIMGTTNLVHIQQYDETYAQTYCLYAIISGVTEQRQAPVMYKDWAIYGYPEISLQ